MSYVYRVCPETARYLSDHRLTCLARFDCLCLAGRSIRRDDCPILPDAHAVEQVYCAIAFYLAHREEIDRYLQQQHDDYQAKRQAARCGSDVLSTQNWRGLHFRLSSFFDFAPLSLPLLLNSIYLLLYERLRKALFELKQAPTLAHSLIRPIEMN